MHCTIRRVTASNVQGVEMSQHDVNGRTSGHRVEARIEALDNDRVRLVLDDVYGDGRRTLFTHIDLSREELLATTFSKQLATLLGENILMRLGAVLELRG
jgi:hypothetical protein